LHPVKIIRHSISIARYLNEAVAIKYPAKTHEEQGGSKLLVSEGGISLVRLGDWNVTNIIQAFGHPLKFFSKY
jgi:hypothetical protein